eukprot:TRINITY_DN5627_c0_g1_i2.p1 TRINITY_DN5627_c0_g1~~TRINITY_DN5627_c0_g1_i2.p1  ORF type:complete len:266 (+),score=30.45 TRINITY_DN5627_c0_g1_i2:269-1066(+)
MHASLRLVAVAFSNSSVGGSPFFFHHKAPFLVTQTVLCWSTNRLWRQTNGANMLSCIHTIHYLLFCFTISLSCCVRGQRSTRANAFFSRFFFLCDFPFARWIGSNAGDKSGLSKVTGFTLDCDDYVIPDGLPQYYTGIPVFMNGRSNVTMEKIVMKDCKQHKETSVPGVYMHTSNLIMKDCVMENMRNDPLSTGSSNGLNLFFNSNVTFINTVFRGNNAENKWGGVFYLLGEETRVDVHNCLFEGNIGKSFGGVFYGQSGTILRV